LTFGDGDFENGTIGGSNDAGFAEAVFYDFLALVGTFKVILGDFEGGALVVEIFSTSELPIVESFGTGEVGFGLFGAEPSTDNFDFGCGEVDVNVGVVDFGEEVASFDGVARANVELDEAASDFGFDIDLEFGHYFTRKHERGVDVSAFGYSGGKLDRRLGGEPNEGFAVLPSPVTSTAKDGEEEGEKYVSFHFLV